jgi:beta-phosphoglucomutase-like phosphatase (HAD superfamily)
VDAVVDGSCVTATKPDPQGFFLASQRLRVLPWNCIGVEDAESGIEAIRRAGMLAIGVGPQAGAADLTVGSVRELTVARLRNLFARVRPAINPFLERNIQILKGESK